MLHNYLDFKTSLNENVQRAKVYLKNKALKKKKEDIGQTDQPVGLSADEVRAIENDSNFLKIKQMCRDNPGLTYLFTKIFYEDYEGDADKISEVQDFYNLIKSLGNSIKDLPQPLDSYANPQTTTGDMPHDGRTISERINDDIENLRLEQKLRKFKGELQPRQKRWIEEANKLEKDRLISIANTFYEMGKQEDGTIDLEEQYSLHRVFFSKVKDFGSLSFLIDFATNYIKSVENNQFSKFVSKIDKVNNQFGPNNGAKMIYNEGGNLVIQVYSYVANKILNGHTTHCIARSQGYWDNYLEGVNNQYYVYDFNLDSTDPMGVIGLTVRPNGSYADLKNKLNINVSDFPKLMSKRGIPMKLFAPPTEEEVAEKRRRIEASKRIVSKGITYEELKQYLEDGADPNARNGIPLQNAVESNDIESVKLLLQKGASPNLAEGSQAPISFAQNLEMIKILVEAGSSLTPSVFAKVADDKEAVKFLLEAGMDPNFNMGYAFRLAAKNGNIDVMQLMLNYADNIPEKDLTLREKQLMMIKERNNLALKNCTEFNQMESLKFLLDKLYELGDEEMKDPETFTREFIDLISSSRLISRKPEVQKTAIKEINDWVKNKLNKNESKRFKSFEKFKY